MRKRWPIVLIAFMVLVVSAVAWIGGGILWRWPLALYKASQTNWPAAGSPEVFTVPFNLITGHIVLNVTVNNSRPLLFILDTGDKFAIIDLDRAKELGLSLGGEITVAGVGSETVTGAFVKDSGYSLSGFAGFSQPVTLAIPLRDVARRLGQDCDGIIGTQFIKQFVVEIDYQAHVINLRNKDTFAYSGTGESIPIQFNKEGHPILNAEVTPIGRDPIRGEFVLDIGSGGSLALYSPFVEKQHLPGPNVKTIREIGSGGAGGEAKGRIGRVSRLKIGKFTFSNPITSFSEDKAGAFADASLLGNIGEELTSKFRIFLDYSHNRVIFEPNAAYAEVSDRAFSGLSIEAEGRDYKTFRIKEVLENSPASESGLQKNDIIKAVDDRATTELTLSDVSEMFERPISYQLTVERGDQTLSVTLTPRQLI